MTLKCCYGISSKTDDDNHILMLDIDKDIPLNLIVRDLRSIQLYLDLKYIIIMKSTNGYNIMSLDKLPLKFIRTIGLLLGYVDLDFLNFGYNRGYFVLRIDFDKEYVCTLYNPNKPLFIQSNAHRKILLQYFNIHIPFIKEYFDSYNGFDLIQFPSDKDGYHKMGE